MVRYIAKPAISRLIGREIPNSLHEVDMAERVSVNLMDRLLFSSASGTHGPGYQPMVCDGGRKFERHQCADFTMWDDQAIANRTIRIACAEHSPHGFAGSPIASAPFGCAVEFAVIDDQQHPLGFPCVRLAHGWLDAITMQPVTALLTHWRYLRPDVPPMCCC
ncbi:hypothetical protein [Bradyrhizobium sp. th.b2]|uniref:hypothetical protein n=1 Tax=Bradyrhizobium sp. th-b2 TaxID=172088 RepID=UPI001FD9834D|nr:hypothetical protein [Bradyrhizobium sp. th.b2]